MGSAVGELAAYLQIRGSVLYLPLHFLKQHLICFQSFVCVISIL